MMGVTKWVWQNIDERWKFEISMKLFLYDEFNMLNIPSLKNLKSCNLFFVDSNKQKKVSKKTET